MYNKRIMTHAGHKKHLTLLCGGEYAPSTRFRVDPIASRLNDHGWDTKTIYNHGVLDQRISNNELRFIYRALNRAKRAVKTYFLQPHGLVLVQRLALPMFGMPESSLAKRTRALVYDFDDAVFLARNGEMSSFRADAFSSVCREAAHVVAGNNWLAEQVPPEAKGITIIPTCLDTKTYIPSGNPRHNDVPRVGWIGTSSNFPYLLQLVKPLEKLRAKGIRFEMVICSDVRNEDLLRKLKAKFTKWSVEEEIPFLQSLDVGLMPLYDDVWCKGKCSFKMIQYLSVGCPVVASAVGMNNDVLRGGKGGKLVDKDWFSPIACLLTDQEHRQASAQDARCLAVEHYDIEIAANLYKSLFEKFL